mgnify:CR=1 FL=1
MCVLAALGLDVASFEDEPVQRVARLTPRLGDAATGATTWGGGWRTGVRDAVLHNGVGVHGRFQDDTDMVAWAHPSPVALTLTEHADGSVDRACRALLGGYAALTWLGATEHVSRAVVERGFRAGPTLGVVTAAVTGSIALGLDQEATRNAIGIAADSAGGTLEPVRAGAED